MAFPWLAAALLAAGTAAKYKANQDMLGQQDEDTARGIRERAALQERGNQKVQENIQKLGKGGAKEQQADTENQYLQALRASQGRQKPAAPRFGASQRFAQDQTNAEAVTNAEGTALAQNLSAINAPLQQRAQEADAAQATASELGALERQASVNDYLTRLRAASRRPSGWLTAGGELLSGLGAGAVASTGAEGEDVVAGQVFDASPAQRREVTRYVNAANRAARRNGASTGGATPYVNSSVRNA